MYGVDPEITKFVDTLSFYVVPVANPDGFEYSRSDVTPQVKIIQAKFKTFWEKLVKIQNNQQNIRCE